jgi:hypothetical protein
MSTESQDLESNHHTGRPGGAHPSESEICQARPSIIDNECCGSELVVYGACATRARERSGRLKATPRQLILGSLDTQMSRRCNRCGLLRFAVSMSVVLEDSDAEQRIRSARCLHDNRQLRSIPQRRFEECPGEGPRVTHNLSV